MTILDIRNQLVGHFCKEDTFCANDFLSIKMDASLEEQRGELVQKALAQLVEAGMVAQIGSELWMLCEPLGSSGQQIDVPIEIAEAIANAINTYIKANDLPLDTVDALNLHAGHLATMVGIISDLVTE